MHGNTNISRFITKVLTLVISFVVHNNVLCSQNISPEKLLIESIQKELSSKLFDRTLAAIEISEIASGRILYSKNTNIYLRPASNAKLFVSAAALVGLPDTFAFKTSVHIQFSPQGEADIWIRGSGDPLLQPEDIQKMAEFVFLNGVRTIRSVHLDATIFDTIYFGQGWMWDDEQDVSMPYLSAFPLAGNKVMVQVSALKTAPQSKHISLNVSTNLLPQFFRIENNGTVGNKDSLTISRQPHANTIVVQGTLKSGSSMTHTLSIWRPQDLVLEFFLNECRNKGIQCDDAQTGCDQLLKDSQEAGAVIHSLKQVLEAINKESDNLSAEMLLKRLAVHFRGIPGTTDDGIAEVRRLLLENDINMTGVRLVDASGISFYNLVTAEGLGSLLRGMANSERFRAYFESMAIGGKDGTMKRRLSGLKGAEYVFAKTGTLRGISALSGYVMVPDSEPLVFVMLMQNFIGEHAPYRRIQDNIVKRCIEYSASRISKKKESKKVQ